MEDQEDNKQDSYSYSGFSDPDLYSGMYSDSESYSEIYFKEKDTPSSKAPEFTEILSATKPQSVSGVPVLTVMLPVVAAVFALLLAVSLIVLWKKVLKRKSLKREPKSPHSKDKISDSKKALKKQSDVPIQLPVSSLRQHFSETDIKGKDKEGVIDKTNTYVEGAEYIEIEEYDDHEMYQKTIFIVENHPDRSEYMELDSLSVDTSVYQTLNKQNRLYDVGNISPNDYQDVTVS